MLTKIVDEYLQANSEAFDSISRQLWERPELMYEEHFAHQVITDFLEERGFTVERGYCKVPTAFRAEFSFGRASSETERVLTVALLCEYDALPEIGHACG
ncbi:hypothetical protein RvY_00791 [Ramazzottius varieornatus]|uniref:Peptidase M20 dimerisation domain-containing protein n=1 Tax=Ramazzottius varieornatus TaxID=947166 RepID=A0A1D1UPC7_RAMVA|nr:hypothetical protein RvY_00791 [Ramazzottius varieornatus]